MKEISKINDNEKLFEIKNLSVLLIGKSGVGKSTLINSLLRLKGNQKAKTNIGKIGTTQITAYTSEKMPFLRLIDTRGIELNYQYGAEQITKECKKYIMQQRDTNNMNNFVHCIWYCITGYRFEDVEIECINILKTVYGENNIHIPIIIIYTQATDNEAIEGMEKYIKEKNIKYEYIKVLAKKKKLPNGDYLKSFGLNILLKKTIDECKKSLTGDMHLLMVQNISNSIEKTLREENSNIKKYIKEYNILKFINEYNIKTEEEFQDYVIKIYGRNINFYLNKSLSKDGFKLIKKSNLINIHYNNFINFYESTVNKYISNNLESLSIQGIMTQADIEKKKGKATLNENKKNYADFVNSNKKFLTDNLNYLAQKNYIVYIFQNICGLLSKMFEDNFNIIVNELLTQPNIKENIHKLFLKRFAEFEKKIDLLSSLPKDDDSFGDNYKPDGNNGSNISLKYSHYDYPKDNYKKRYILTTSKSTDNFKSRNNKKSIKNSDSSNFSNNINNNLRRNDPLNFNVQKNLNSIETIVTTKPNQSSVTNNHSNSSNNNNGFQNDNIKFNNNNERIYNKTQNNLINRKIGNGNYNLIKKINPYTGEPILTFYNNYYYPNQNQLNNLIGNYPSFYSNHNYYY